MKTRLPQNGFSTVIVLAVLLSVAVIGLGAWRIGHTSKHAVTSSKKVVNTQQKPTTPVIKKPTDPYADWKDYTDTGYAEASGIAIKYPPDWQVKVGDSKVYAWQVIKNSVPNVNIGIRVVILDKSVTAQEEWDNCPSADACGPSPEDTKLEGSTSITNGLDSYNVKMQNNTGIYYAVVIKGSKPLDDGTVAFTEFILHSSDPTVLASYHQIVASAHY